MIYLFHHQHLFCDGFVFKLVAVGVEQPVGRPGSAVVDHTHGGVGQQGGLDFSRARFTAERFDQASSGSGATLPGDQRDELTWL